MKLVDMNDEGGLRSAARRTSAQWPGVTENGQNRKAKEGSNKFNFDGIRSGPLRSRF